MSTILKIIICAAVISNEYSFCKAKPLSGWVEPAQPYEFPFVVSIGRNFDIPPSNPYGHTCGGALVGKRYVLTSANCFLPNKTTANYFVYVGSNDLAKSQKFQIESWITHDCWLKARKVCIGYHFSDNDIAIIKLLYNVPTVQPVKLSNILPVNLEGRSVISAGWGLLFNDTKPQHMLKADLRVISRNQCFQGIFEQVQHYSYSHEHNIFCTNGVTLFAVLDEGDRGSPVFLKLADGAYRMVGVNQKAIPYVNDVTQIPDQQNLHISVHHYSRFIKSVTGIRYSS